MPDSIPELFTETSEPYPIFYFLVFFLEKSQHADFNENTTNESASDKQTNKQTTFIISGSQRLD